MTLDGTVWGLQAPVKPREEGMNPLRLACESHLLSLSKQLAPRSRRRRMLGTVATLRLSRNHIEDSEQSHGILHRPPSHKGLSETEVGERTRLPFDGGALVFYGQPHLRTIRIRMA